MLRHIFSIVTCTLTVCLALPASAQVVTGTVSHPDASSLPPTAVVEITLADVSRPDAPAPIAVGRFDGGGPLPFDFELSFDPGAIHPGRRYGLVARVLDRDQLVHTTLSSSLVLTHGHGHSAELTLAQVAAPPPPPANPMATGAPLDSPPSALDRARARLVGSPGGAMMAPVAPALPATFTGTLPCEGCAGTRAHLNLFADDAYVLRLTEQGRDVVNESMGSWSLSSDGRVLVLGGPDGATHQFLLTESLALRAIDQAGQPASTTTRSELRKAASFEPIEVRLPMEGGYRMAGDVALFTECATGRTWNVADGGAAASLVSRYRQARPGGEAALMVRVDGRVSDRPAAASGGVMLTVDSVASVMPEATCEPRFSSASLEQTRWELRRLGSTSVTAASDARNQAHLMFDAARAAFYGTAGCNRMVGQYDTLDDQIALEVGGTMRACAENATDRAFAEALQNARRYRVVGRQLFFYGEDGSVIAELGAGQ